MVPPDESQLRTPNTERRTFRWLTFFLILAVMGSVAVVLPIWYNLSLQLKPEDVARARTRWQEQQPRDYDLELMRRENQQVSADEYRVKVRGGKLTSILSKADGILLVDEAVGLAVGPSIRVQPPPEDLPPLTVEQLFDEIEANLKRDAETTGKRNYAMASFVMKEEGYPSHYVHRIAGTKQRIEWNVRLTAYKDGPP